MNANGLCSVLIHSRCSPNTRQPVTQPVPGMFMSWKSLWKKELRFGLRCCLLEGSWSIIFITEIQNTHWSLDLDIWGVSTRGEVCWEWSHYPLSPCYSVQATTFVAPQGYSQCSNTGQLSWSMTWWQCGWFSVPGNNTTCVCVCVYTCAHT